jgi:cupin fold WbuC family metalloprotein|tara:strand:- start:56544 stop:56954 length:411 start_codon:yes stop_codon:yes gene_type:complete
MEKIYSKIKPELLLHVINKKEEITSQRQDLISEEEDLQVSCFLVSKDKESRPHKHIKQVKTTHTTQESWIVVNGSIKVILYDLDDSIIKEENLKLGDCLITLGGGHKFIALEEDTAIYECKNGPYQGPDKDRTFID